MDRRVSSAPEAGALRQRLGRYEVLQELGRGTTGVVYEVRDGDAGAVMALKTLASPDPENLFHLKHEFRSLANLEHESFVHFGELSCEDGQWFFTMERVYGTDFLSYVCGAPPEASGRQSAAPRADKVARLRAALAQLVEALAVLHEAGRIHRDVKPSNVLVTTEGRLVLLDFGLTTGFGSDQRILGTPHYMAPEQIACDPLTPAVDWYAVGGMLYAALTGGAPFEGTVPEILDAKLTQDAPRVPEGDAPEDLRELCEALLQREPRDRPGLDEIRERLGLASPARASMREVFVGRTAELQRLRDGLARAPSDGAQLVVRGEPGVGKSALVERLLADLPARALVLRGRCYEQERVPFGGVDSLIDALSEHLLGLGESEADRVLAGGASNVARIFPVLTRVPVVAAQRVDGPALNPAMLREQAFQELARLLATLSASRTLVVYVDDLQWVDGDSLALLRDVIVPGVRRLFVATLRSECALSDEVAAFVGTLEAIDVPRLSGDESQALWRALGATPDDASSGAAVREAGGHPLFLTEFVRASREGRLAEQSHAARLQDVLWARIAERDALERQLIEIAAFAGAPTPYGVLARAAGLDPGECSTRLAALRAAQLVRVSRLDGERCVEPYHDRIRESVMERLQAKGEEPNARLHWALGRALLDATPPARLPSRIFTIVQHLDAGRAQARSEQERLELAALNLTASRQAHGATSFERACEYAAFGAGCLPQGAATRHRALWRDLLVAKFSAEHLAGRRDAARATFEATARELPSPADKVPAYGAWLDLDAGTSPQDALSTGREILQLLGAPPPRAANKLHVLAAYWRAWRAQRGRPAEAFRDAPPLRDETARGVLRVLAALLPAAYFCDENLFPWALLEIARISMDRGMSDESPVGLVGYGMFTLGALGRFAQGAAFGRVADEMARAHGDPQIATQTAFMVPCFLTSWVAPFARAWADLAASETVAARSGSTSYQVYSATEKFEMSCCAGVDLAKTRAEARAAKELGVRFNVNAGEHGESFETFAAALTGARLVDAPWPMPLGGVKSDLPLFRHHLFQSELGYLAGRSPDVVEQHIALARRYAHTAFCVPLGVDLCLIEGLVAARACRGASLLGRARRIVQIALALRKLEAWSRVCPANFESHALLARAEYLRVRGRARAASDAYARAADSAAGQGAAKREAIACELAASHARARGASEDEARLRARAVDAYRRWGATAKADALEGRAPGDGAALE